MQADALESAQTKMAGIPGEKKKGRFFLIVIILVIILIIYLLYTKPELWQQVKALLGL
jgi:hypothetical protein